MQELEVVLSHHARRQLSELGDPAEHALRVLSDMTLDEITLVAEPLPAQHGREMWLLWAGRVRILFDVEHEELTIHGFGRVPHR